MNTRILNRAGQLPEDGWYNIEANGEHVNPAAKVVQVIDEAAVSAIVNRFNADAAKSGEFAGMRMDKDHLSQSMENSTESYGWAMQLRNREGLIEAKIDWTSLGKPLVESKPNQPPAYKFFSTEYEPSECEKIGTRIINRETYAVLRPMRLAGLSLTNDPNNKGQRPISNRSGDADAGKHQPDTTMKNIMKSLGLAEDAPEASAVSEIQKIQNRATSAEAERDTFKTENTALKTTQVEADLETYKGVITNRDSVKAMLLSNRTGTIELLKSLKVPAAGESSRITNRGLARTPEQGAASEGTPAEEARAAKISNRASQLRSQDRSLSLSKSYEKAEAEISAQ